MFDFTSIEEMIDGGCFDSWLGSGAGRDAYRINDKLVVKVNREDSARQSLHEIVFFNEHFNQYSHLMAEIHGWANYKGHVLIFMEYIDMLGECIDDYLDKNYSEEEADKKMLEIEAFEDETRLWDSSENAANWGIRPSTGELVVVDYGMSEYQPYADDEDAGCYDFDCS